MPELNPAEVSRTRQPNETTAATDTTRPETYPPGVLPALMGSEFLTGATWQAFAERIADKPAGSLPAFLPADLLETLVAVCARLLPNLPGEADLPKPRTIAMEMDVRLAKNEGNGWRYDALPPDGAMFAKILRGLNEVATKRGAPAFAALGADAQDDLLRTLRDGTATADGGIGDGLDTRRVFEEWLAEAAELFYSDPRVQETFGFVGYADRRGWPRIGLNERVAWQPKAGDKTYTLPTVAELPPIAPVLTIPPPTPPMGFGTAGDPVDVVIIGTGAGGAPILARLAQAGLRVVALEAGKFWKPAQDFATDERAQSKLYWTDERLSAGATPLAFGNNNSGIGVGGSTLHYTAYTPRPHADDFRIYSDFGVGANWPFGYDELEPYLTEAEQFLGVSGPSNYPWTEPRSAPYPLAALPLNAPAQLMARGCDKLGLRSAPAPNAALSGAYFQKGIGWRPACTNRGFCQAGCSVGAKASMDVTYVALALHHGAEVRSECFVTEIETDKTNGRVKAVVYTDAIGKTVRQPCRALFLCAGAVESPRLLLLNKLGNESGQVGKNFMAHPGVQVWAQFDEETYPTRGIPGGLISEETHRPNQSRVLRERFGAADFASGYLLQSIGVMPVTYVSQFARGTKRFGNDLHSHMLGFNHVAGINILGEGLPYERNFLELSDENDARGLPKPRIHYSEGENETRINRHAESVMRAIFKEAGAARKLWSFQRSAHTLGTCRMGSDAKTSVVNPDGRVWESPNLFICDNGVFPSALSVNPALTQIALSLRTADRFLESNRRGGI